MLNDYPYLDLEPTRVLNDLLVEPGATVNAYNQINIDRARRSMSLLEIEKDPTLADDIQVDRILSNWKISREEGSKAAGPITIFLSDNTTVSIPRGEVFTAAGLNFVTDTAYVGTSAALQTAADRPIIDLGNGTYSLTIPVEGAEEGSAYKLRRGTQITWTTPVSTYINSSVETDFTGGEDPQTNQDMINQLDNGLAAKAMAGRQNIDALLMDFAPTIKAISSIGMGDPEMLRDSHNIFAIKTGGKTDIYTRTDLKPADVTLTKSCMLVDADQKIFQVLIGREDHPGFYEIAAIVPVGVTNFEGSLEVTQDVRGFDTSEMPYVIPEIYNIVEAAYSRFQTAVVQFKDPTYAGTAVVGDYVDYKVTLTGMPLIDSIQDHIAARRVRNTQGDYLVRAPIPLPVAVSMQIQYVRGDQVVDTAAVREQIVATINAFGFDRGSLPVSLLVDAVQETLPDRAVVKTPVTLTGRIRYPSGEYETFVSTTQLDFPSDPDESTSSRTIGAYTDYDIVAVSVEQVETLPV